ncbi:MAG: L-rhamnose mutarotase [Lachnospiraceae bacterium]|jgi:L-rhamnose mutarotase|nr:L-rhamnose mutarotase [Lachnospiraceae bacterium]
MEYAKGKHAYMAVLHAEEREQAVSWLREKEGRMNQECLEAGICNCRIYIQELEGKDCLFAYVEEEAGRKQAESLFLGKATPFSWHEARQVYEFKSPAEEDLTGLSARGIIIGVKRDYLEEYVRLHDEQPQVIRDLCYENGFRRSSIFVTGLEGGGLYLTQFVECRGEENPALYENETYREWLKVTGECQVPLPGEHFWKEMKPVYELEG